LYRHKKYIFLISFHRNRSDTLQLNTADWSIIS